MSFVVTVHSLTGDNRDPNGSTNWHRMPDFVRTQRFASGRHTCDSTLLFDLVYALDRVSDEGSPLSHTPMSFKMTF